MRNHEDVSVLVMREINDVVYIADVETYELLFMNQSAIELLGNPETTQWKGKQCYKVLQNRDAPCEFCTNACLNRQEFHCWERYNDMMGRYFSMKDKLVEWDGRLVRLEIAVDITEKEKMYRRLEKNLITEKTIVSCIRTLSMNNDLTAAIHNLLGTIGDYYRGERAYIFEFDYGNERLSNTYEWCKAGITPQIENLKNLPLSAVDHWIEEFQEKGEFYLPCLEEKNDKNSMEYLILEAQGVQSLIAAPLLEEENIIGFIGVDNPTANIEEMVLLQSVTFFILDEIKKKRLTSELKKLSYKDLLTGVWNRNKYTEVLEQFESRTPERLGIIYADINGLKQANDLHGHAYGDRLISHVAEVMNELFPESVYRIGGDEFIILCTNLSYGVFNKKVDQLYDVIQLDESVNLSIGLKWMEDGEDVNKQITTADRLMYADKQRYYSTRMSEKATLTSGLAKHLIQKIKDGNFTIYLQPKTEIQSGRLYGAEALVRRFDNEGHLEAPIQFIPRYEAEGIIRYVDLFVLERVCEHLAHWRELGNNQLKVAVNLSRFTLMEYQITEKLQQICSRYEISTERIVIEVTETIGQMDKAELKRLMQALKTAGFTVSLDDFGAEYSSLAMLTALQFDEIKLDKSLIDQIVKNKKSKIVTSYAINLCRDLGNITSVAEGIETEEQLLMLKKLRCEVGQGYLIDRPLPVDEFEHEYILGKKEYKCKRKAGGYFYVE